MLRLACFAWCLLAVGWSFAAENDAPAQRPNFVFILVDDLGLKDLSCEGSDFYETPHIDHLASRSMRFTQGYACCQVCSPSRASIMLGQFPARHGITDWIGAASGTAWNRDDKLLPADYVKELPRAQTTIAEALQLGGYRTFFAGKWHLGGKGSWPEDHGFEINLGGFEKGSPPGGFFSPFNNPHLPDGAPGESLTLRLADETAKFIRSQQGDRPFFAMLSFYAVHSPVQTTESLWRKYRDKASRREASESRFEIDRTLPVRQVQDHPIYAGMIETLDEAVGRVIDAIEQQGLKEQTVVIFTSDNGGVSSGDAYSTSNLPLRGGKGRQWEGGIREPYYILVPGLTDAEEATKSGPTSNTPVTGSDFFPTILELANLPLRPEQHLDGVSLLPLLHGKTIPERPLVWHYPHYGNQGGEPSSIYRQGPWKLIHYYEDSRDELYHLRRDPGEQNDVAQEHPERVKTMRQSLENYLQSVDAKYPEPDPRFTQQAGDAKRDRVRAELLPRLEKQHAEFLDPDFHPGKNWWGSSLWVED